MVELELGETLHNLADDIGEQKNLIEEHPEIVSELKKIHQKWKEKMK